MLGKATLNHVTVHNQYISMKVLRIKPKFISKTISSYPKLNEISYIQINQSFQEPKIIKNFKIKCIPFFDNIEDSVAKGQSICFDRESDYVIANEIMKSIQDLYLKSFSIWKRPTIMFMI